MERLIGDNYRTVTVANPGSFSTTATVNYAWIVPRLHIDGMLATNEAGKYGAIVYAMAGLIAHGTPCPASTITVQTPKYGARKKYPAVMGPSSLSAAWGEADTWGHLDKGAGASRISGGSDMPTIADVSLEWLAGGRINAGAGEPLVRNFLSGVAFRPRNMQPLPVAMLYEITPRPSIPNANLRSVYDAGMPCSAYLMRCIVSGNANAISYGTVGYWQFPAVGIVADS